MLHLGLTVRGESHLVLCHHFLITALDLCLLLLPLGDSLLHIFVHLLSLELNLAIHFIETDASEVHLDELLLAQLDPVVHRGLIKARERDVSDLLHREHAWLLEPLTLQLLRVP